MTLSLTEDLVARLRRNIEDAGPAPGLICLKDEDYVLIRRRLLADRPVDQDLWIFAYGSLLWNPCFEAAEGWRRLNW